MDDVPTVVQVLSAIRPNFVIGRAWMAREFLEHNGPDQRRPFDEALAAIHVDYEPHVEFKRRVPQAIGLVRTGDTTLYANVILESG